MSNDLALDFNPDDDAVGFVILFFIFEGEKRGAVVSSVSALNISERPRLFGRVVGGVDGGDESAGVGDEGDGRDALCVLRLREP